MNAAEMTNFEIVRVTAFWCAVFTVACGIGYVIGAAVLFYQERHRRLRRFDGPIKDFRNRGNL